MPYDELPPIEAAKQLLINLYDELPMPHDITTNEAIYDIVVALNDHFPLFLRDYLRATTDFAGRTNA